MKKARRGQTASLRGFPTRAERSHERRYGRDRIPQASEASSRKSTHADSGGQGQGVHRAVGGCRFPAERRGGGLADGSQSTDLQRDALRAAGVATRRLYEDRASGRLDARPGLDAALKALRRGDTLIVWKLDRLGRDLRHLINIVHDLSTRSIGFKVLTGHGASIDTTTSAGKLVFGIFASLAEFERDLISERTKAGLASARARGRKGGAPFKMTAAKVRLAMAAMGQKETKVADLCSELGVTRQTLYRHVAPNGTLRKDGSRVVEGGKNRKPQGKKP
jgi:DNA invertase Pin-like site-specific DNA recombinase